MAMLQGHDVHHGERASSTPFCGFEILGYATEGQAAPHVVACDLRVVNP
jgi:hypothetical protein